MINLNKSHTGYELELMVKKTKPLAIFYYSPNIGDRDLVPEREFDIYVEKGLFRKDFIDFEGNYYPPTQSNFITSYILYAINSESWRIEAVKIALTQMIRMGWADEGIDRITGALLGYNQYQIDEYIAQKDYLKLRKKIISRNLNNV